MRTAVDTGVNSSKAQKDISTLINRVHVLEMQNTKLRLAAKRDIASTMQVTSSGNSEAKAATTDSTQHFNVTGLVLFNTAVKACFLNVTPETSMQHSHLQWTLSGRVTLMKHMLLLKRHQTPEAWKSQKLHFPELQLPIAKCCVTRHLTQCQGKLQPFENG